MIVYKGKKFPSYKELHEWFLTQDIVIKGDTASWGDITIDISGITNLNDIKNRLYGDVHKQSRETTRLLGWDFSSQEEGERCIAQGRVVLMVGDDQIYIFGNTADKIKAILKEALE